MAFLAAAIVVDLRWLVIYLALGIPLLVTELVAVRRPQEGDTISESVWWLQRHFWPARVGVAVFLAWAFGHFLFHV